MAAAMTSRASDRSLMPTVPCRSCRLRLALQPSCAVHVEPCRSRGTAAEAGDRASRTRSRASYSRTPAAAAAVVVADARCSTC